MLSHTPAGLTPFGPPYVLAFSDKPLNGVVWAPSERTAGSQTIWLSGEEITGEFLGEMKSIKQGVGLRLRHFPL